MIESNLASLIVLILFAWYGCFALIHAIGKHDKIEKEEKIFQKPLDNRNKWWYN